MVIVAPDHTRTHGRTPLDEGSALPQNLYMETQRSQETDIHDSDAIRTGISSKIHALNRAATGIGRYLLVRSEITT